MTKQNDLALISEKDLSLTNENSLNGAQLQHILRRTPKQYVKERPAKGGGTWKYVSVGYFKKCLNLMFGWDWDFEIVEDKIVGGSVVVLGRLTCRSNGKQIVKMQYGSKEIIYKNDYTKDASGKQIKTKTDQPLDIGNDFKAAASDSLKKCATDLGIAADIYNAEEFKEVSIKETTKEKNQEIENILD